MKKIALLTAVLLACSIGSAFAAYETGPKTLGSTETLEIQLSNDVLMDYVGDTTNGLGYVVGAYHTSGTRTYASSSGDAKIHYQDGTAVAIPSTAPTGTASADFSAWEDL